MNTMWLTANYLAEVTRRRIRAIFKTDAETGALSLEWIVIAAILFAAATAAAILFNKAISVEAGKLP